MPILAITSGVFTVSINESMAIVLLDSEKFGEVCGLLESLDSVCVTALLSVAVGPRWTAKTRITGEGASRILLDVRQVSKTILNVLKSSKWKFVENLRNLPNC